MEIDARGLACPQPVLMIKEELEKIDEGVVTVLVDNKGSSINVRNFCEANGYAVNVVEIDDYYKIDAAKGYDCVISEETVAKTNIVVLISGECIGSEEPELGKMLMKGFIGNIKNLDSLPETIIFLNNSVRMVTTNEETIDMLKELADKGVEILACGACLEYFKLVEQLKVGNITDAFTVGTKVFNADKLIRI